MGAKIAQQLEKMDLAQPLVDEICDELDASDELREVSIRQARRVDFELNVNRSGSVVAAASVYMHTCILREHHTQEEIAEVADISTPSLRAAWKEIAHEEGLPHESYASLKLEPGEASDDERLFDGLKFWRD